MDQKVLYHRLDLLVRQLLSLRIHQLHLSLLGVQMVPGFQVSLPNHLDQKHQFHLLGLWDLCHLWVLVHLYFLEVLVDQNHLEVLEDLLGQLIHLDHLVQQGQRVQFHQLIRVVQKFLLDLSVLLVLLHL